YRPYCRYTLDPSPDGKYTGPDLATARRLVAASRTKGQAVTVWINKCCVNVGPAYIVSVLRRLGYRARLKVVSTFPAYFAAIQDSRRKVQAAGNVWEPDYLAAATFFTPLLSCASF